MGEKKKTTTKKDVFEENRRKKEKDTYAQEKKYRERLKWKCALRECK